MNEQPTQRSEDPSSNKGRFIVLDGLDGCGKTTQAKRLVEALRERGRDVLHTREPGGTDVGEAVRKVLLDPAMDVNATAELFLYQAARAQLSRQVIGPALRKGTDVVCERWHFSTMAYQCGGGGADAEQVRISSGMATGGTEPELAILLHIDPELSLRRIDRPLDRMEQRDLEYRTRVAASFHAQFNDAGPARIIVKADATQDVVFGHIWNAARELF